MGSRKHLAYLGHLALTVVRSQRVGHGRGNFSSFLCRIGLNRRSIGMRYGILLCLPFGMFYLIFLLLFGIDEGKAQKEEGYRNNTEN